ncbi:MAG: hypothetical protein GY911_07375, partial [Actinomycetales bacterium]|nr:hypothetical protein [Actinomycetales bacterium]
MTRQWGMVFAWAGGRRWIIDRRTGDAFPMSDPEMLDQSDVDTLMDAVESGDLRDEQRPARIFSRFR